MKYLSMYVDFINESKQLGLLYHWTDDLYTLEKILKTDSMWSSYGYISFSRNKLLDYQGRTIKIIFDGTAMSNKFKFKSYLYNRSKHYTNEAEERVECSKSSEQITPGVIDCIRGIIKYIIGVDIEEKRFPELVFEEQMKKIKKYISSNIIRII